MSDAVPTPDGARQRPPLTGRQKGCGCLLAALAALLLFAGCGALLGGGDSATPKPSASPSAAVAAPASPSPTEGSFRPTEAATGAQPAPATKAGDRYSGLKTYMRENFADTSWDPSNTGYHDEFGETWVDTKLYPDTDAPAAARSICAAVSSWQITDGGGFKGVRVAASTGQRLSWRKSLGEAC